MNRGVFQAFLYIISQRSHLLFCGYMATQTNLWIVAGEVIAVEVVSTFSTRKDECFYRLPEGLQWA
jgi:hypothetical protein